MAFDVIARTLIMPVLLGQAFFLRRRVIQLAEPTGARSGKTGSGPVLRLLVFGDSSAIGVGADTLAEALLGQLTQALSDRFEVHFDLVATTGARTKDALVWLPDLPQQRYDVVVTALGVNDVTKLTSAREFRRHQARLLDWLITQRGAGLVAVSGLPPMHQFPLLPQPLRWVLGAQAKRFDAIIGALVQSRKACCKINVDLGLDRSNMSRDGFHPGPVVYAAWAQEVVAAIDAHAPPH